jgi:hypothetical protein
MRSRALPAILATALLLVLSATSLGSFKKARTFAAGNFPVDVVVADFNRDGNRDLATANSGSQDVSILLGNGKGRFRVKRTLKLGGQFPTAIAAGRLDGDRRPDLAVARTDISNGSVKVFKGRRHTRFKSKGSFPLTGDDPVDLAIADLDRDGRRDVVTVDRTFDIVSVLLGKGNGALEAGADYPSGNASQQIALGRLNADKRLDALVPNLADDTVSVLYGKQGGAFEPRQTIPVDDKPVTVAVGKVVGDTAPDILVGYDFVEELFVLSNVGAGFVPVGPFAMGAPVDRIAVAKLDDDKRRDIAVVQRGNPGKVRLLVGRPNGSLKLKAGGAPIATDGYEVVAARLNGDGRTDLAVADGPPGTVSVLIHK